MTEKQVAVLGGGWVTSAGYGQLRDGSILAPDSGAVVIPPKKDIFANPSPRYGRFDDYTKMGCSAVALALADADLAQGDGKRPIGIVSSSKWESTNTDLAYYETVAPSGGALASPHLFSYTLPGITHGESAITFGLTGPMICVGERGGLGVQALKTAVRLLRAHALDTVLAGWLDDPPPAQHDPRGAVFVVLHERLPRAGVPGICLTADRAELFTADGRCIFSIVDLFGPQVPAPGRELTA